MKIPGTHTYVFRGTFWTVGKMKFGDVERARALLAENFPEMTVKDFELSALLGELMDRGVLKRGVALMLRPVRGFALWNRLLLKFYGHAPDGVVYLMDVEQIAEVATDFFFVNVSWIASYFSFTSNTILSMERIPILKDLLYLKNPLSPSPTAT